MVAGLQEGERAVLGDQVTREAARSRDVLGNRSARLGAPLGVVRRDPEGPGLGYEDRTGGDLGAGVGDRDGPAAGRLRIFDAGEDRAVLGQQ